MRYALIDSKKYSCIYISGNKKEVYKYYCLHFLIPSMKEQDNYSLMEQNNIESFDDLWDFNNEFAVHNIMKQNNMFVVEININ